MTEKGKRCASCGALCSHGSDFCPSCGLLFKEAGEVSCSNHSSRPAVQVCVICQEPFCGSCVRRIHDRALCADHAAVKLEQDFALVYSSSDINDAELARAILDSRGFHVVVRDFTPIGYVWEGAGDSAFSRSALRKLAKVFVPIPEYLRALVILNEWSTAQQTHRPGA